jgi:hypothetical protein
MALYEKGQHRGVAALGSRALSSLNGLLLLLLLLLLCCCC